MISNTQPARLLDFVRSRGMIRPRELQAIDVPRSVLARLVEQGELLKRARGVYTLPNHQLSRHTNLAEVCKRSPNSTVCLVSALDFHELTTQIPHAVWLMIDGASKPPTVAQLAIRVVYASGESLAVGVETHNIEGVPVRCTNPAKTVVDCFKYVSHVGKDVAIEALRDCLSQRKATPDDLFEMAKIDRVANKMQPYLEVLA
jgi:predicted transcriptional regulator of viral defense system